MMAGPTLAKCAFALALFRGQMAQLEKVRDAQESACALAMIRTVHSETPP